MIVIRCCRLCLLEQFIKYIIFLYFFFFQAEDGIRDIGVTGVQTCALPILVQSKRRVKSAERRIKDSLLLILHSLLLSVSSFARLRVPAVRAAENPFDRDRLRFRPVQLARPGHARTRVRARPRAVVLGVARRLLALRLIPVVPAGGTHDLRHPCVEIDDAGERTPRSAQVGSDRRRLARDTAVREDEAERLAFGSGGGGDVAVSEAVYVAALEEGGCAAEDEVHVARDVAVLEVLPPAVEQNRVLPAEEAAVAERDAVAVNAQGERLPDGAGGVLEGEVLGGEVVGVNVGRGRAERADGQARRPREVRVQVEGENRPRRVLADETDEVLLALHVDQLFVCARLDADDGGAVGGGRLRHGVDRLLHGLVLARAVRRDDQRRRLRGARADNADGQAGEQAQSKSRRRQCEMVRSLHVGCLRPVGARVAAVALLRRLDVDVSERDRAGVLQHLGGLHAAERAVYEAHVFDDRAGPARDPHDARAGRASDVLQLDVTHHGLVRAVRPRLVHEVYRQYRLGDPAHFDVAHKDVLDRATAPRVRLEAQRAVEVRTVHAAVLDEDVAAAAGNLAPHDDAAVPVLHRAAADDDIFGGDADAPTVVVAARLDGDAVVARVEDAVGDKHVAGGFRVAAVVVRPVAADLYAAHGDVRGAHGVNLPHRRVDDPHALDEHVSTAVRLYKVWPEEVALTEDALTHGHAPLAVVEQAANA